MRQVMRIATTSSPNAQLEALGRRFIRSRARTDGWRSEHRLAEKGGELRRCCWSCCSGGRSILGAPFCDGGDGHQRLGVAGDELQGELYRRATMRPVFGTRWQRHRSRPWQQDQFWRETMKDIVAYLTFDGNCEEAMTFYAKALGAAFRTDEVRGLLRESHSGC